MAEPSQSSKDSLGLDIESLKVAGEDDDAPAEQTPAAESDAPATPAAEGPDDAAPPASATSEQPPTVGDAKLPPRERKKPYVNPERVRTGGTQRVCSGLG